MSKAHRFVKGVGGGLSWGGEAEGNADNDWVGDDGGV